MQCPVCNLTLSMTHRQGVEIDYCPQCRGVWLDRGELDKILERQSQQAAPQASYREQGGAPNPNSEPRYGEHYHRNQRPYKKKKSLLSEIFDF